MTTQVGTARFESLRSWVHTDIKDWTLADMIDERLIALLQREADAALVTFVKPDGTVVFDASAHIVTARKERN